VLLSFDIIAHTGFFNRPWRQCGGCIQHLFLVLFPPARLHFNGSFRPLAGQVKILPVHARKVPVRLHTMVLLHVLGLFSSA